MLSLTYVHICLCPIVCVVYILNRLFWNVSLGEASKTAVSLLFMYLYLSCLYQRHIVGPAQFSASCVFWTVPPAAHCQLCPYGHVSFSILIFLYCLLYSSNHYMEEGLTILSVWVLLWLHSTLPVWFPMECTFSQMGCYWLLCLEPLLWALSPSGYILYTTLPQLYF